MSKEKVAVPQPVAFKTTHISAERHLQLSQEVVDHQEKTGKKISIRDLVDYKLAVPFKGFK